jgi:hypothetical protein
MIRRASRNNTALAHDDASKPDALAASVNALYSSSNSRSWNSFVRRSWSDFLGRAMLELYQAGWDSQDCFVIFIKLHLTVMLLSLQ